MIARGTADEASTIDWEGVAHPRASGAPRIASLVPSLTDLMFALRVGDHVVARTGFCVRPHDEVRRVPKIGGTKTPDLKRLRELEPTHLVVNVDENRLDDVEAARVFVPHVIVTDPRAPDDNLRLYRLFGALFDREAEAEALAKCYTEAAAALDAESVRHARERVLYLIWRRPWMTVSRETYIAATLARAGCDTLPSEVTKRYPVVADDGACWHDAERILLSSEPYAFRARDATELANRWRKPVELIDGEWTSWYGARAIDGLRALAEWRHGRSLLGDRT